jgi:hypothetical protein
MQIADSYAPWKIASVVNSHVLQALQFQKISVCLKFPGWADKSLFT